MTTSDARKMLADIMSFDHVITVHPDGTVTDGPGDKYAPDLWDGEIDNDQWELFTHGYSGQDRYSGPIMHNSEFIGGSLADDILSEPGIYVSIVAYWTPEEDDEDEDSSEDNAEGWAIARLKVTE